jgi:hypothetical protein
MSANYYCDDVIQDDDSGAARDKLGQKRNAEGLLCGNVKTRSHLADLR